MQSNNNGEDLVNGPKADQQGPTVHFGAFGNGEPNAELPPEPPIEQQPKFTEEDERQEISELTSDELLKIQRDLLGVEQITDGLSNACIDHGDESLARNEARKRPKLSSLWDRLNTPKDPLAQRKLTPAESLLLKSLDEELLKLPVEDTDIYYEALIKCPEEISPDRRLAFLNYDGNPARAAKRLANYWDFRHEVFGPSRCFLPMTLAGAMQDEVLPMAQRAVYQLLPATDAAGRAILYFAFQKRDWEQYSLKQEFMAIIYQMELLMGTEEIREKGFIFLIDGRNSTRKHYSVLLSTYISRFDDAFPITIRSAHICYPMSVLYYVILPVIKAFLPKRIRVRIKMHYGTKEEVVKSLADYNLPIGCVPVEIGGKLVLEPAHFLVQRLEKEMIPMKEEGTANSKTNQKAEPEDDLKPSAPISQDSGGISEYKKATKKQKKKRSYNAENAGDPRMSKALKAKIDNPDMSLYEALLVGGFSFAPGQGTKDIDVKDSDGISLKQVSLSIMT